MEADLERLFSAVGCTGFVCAQDPAGEHEVALRADEPVAAASVIKLLVAVEVERQIGDGRLAETQRVRLRADDRTPGPVGFSFFADDVETSVRDLLVPMLTVSDNVATDALLDLVGIEACNATAAELGLTGTAVVSDLHSMIDAIARSGGFADWTAFVRASQDGADDADVVTGAMLAGPPLQAATANRTTARDMSLLLRLVWSDAAAPTDGCARIRHLMRHQLTRHRLAAAFAAPTRVAAKSGGLLGVYRHEVGVVERPDGTWCTAAVLTRATARGTAEAAVNHAIGQAAALAVQRLAGGGPPGEDRA